MSDFGFRMSVGVVEIQYAVSGAQIPTDIRNPKSEIRFLSRRELLAGIPALALAKRRPNVLGFRSDQETAMVPGPVNNPHHRRLNEQGVRFSNAFCNTPQCSAARSSLLTGLEPHQTGVLTIIDGTSLGRSLSPKLATIGSVFRNAGYRTGYFGKWHLGSEEAGRDAFGF